MEQKKNENADVFKKSGLFLSVALLITMSITVIAFEWKSYDKANLSLMNKNVDAFDDIVDVPPTEQPPPEPPKVQQPQIIEVPDEEEIEVEIDVTLDVEVTDNSEVEEIVAAAEEPEEEVDEIFTIVENPASPKGGMAAFYKYVGENIKYPAQARRMNITGRVFVEFIIDKKGHVTNVKVVKGIGANCDEEAVRVLKESPPWTPGKQRGKPVKQRMVLPITFKLG